MQKQHLPQNASSGRLNQGLHTPLTDRDYDPFLFGLLAFFEHSSVPIWEDPLSIFGVLG